MALLDLRCAWLIGLAFSFALPALAEVDEALLAGGWEEITFDDKTPNRFAPDGEGGVIVQSKGSVSLIQRPLDIDLAKTPLLAWRWRVGTQAPPSDLGVKGEDDRSLALYIAFPYQPEEAGVLEKMKRVLVEATAGEDAPGRVLTYVWGGLGERGDRIESPYLGSSGMMTILRPAGTPSETWFEETIDISEDYRQTFGSEPPDPVSIAISADTDDTRSMADGVVTGLTFVERPKAF